jgi:ketosteroid isomerase-like protein
VAEPGVEATEFLSAGDRVVALISFRGRGINSGVPFEVPEAHILRLSGGKVVELQSYADTATIARALTATPAAAR